MGVGEGVCPIGNKTKWLRYNEAEKIVDLPLGNKVLLSYDIDVFDPSITTAHNWGFSGRMFPEQVKDLSAKILEGRYLVGINVASYDPSKEVNENYKTVDIIVDSDNSDTLSEELEYKICCLIIGALLKDSIVNNSIPSVPT